jgi:hypothetical protein
VKEGMASPYILVLNNEDAVRWVVRESAAAFSPARRKQAELLGKGDELFVYTTLTCFGSGTADAPLLIARAAVAEDPVALDRPLQVGEGEYVVRCDISLTHLAPIKRGVGFKGLVGDLETFAYPEQETDSRFGIIRWSHRLRTALCPITEADANVLRAALEPFREGAAKAIHTY